MGRIFAVAAIIAIVGCSSDDSKPGGAADASTAIDAATDAGVEAGIDAGSFPACRPTGAACADDIMACCTMACRATVDLDGTAHSACE